MKIGVIGAGSVGAATISALVRTGGVSPDVVIVDRDEKKAAGLAEDMTYVAALSSLSSVRAGGYDQLEGASLVIVTAGVNEKNGGATDRNDPKGRLNLIPVNAKAYREMIPAATHAAPEATLLVVTDPPDPLADLARALAPTTNIVSAGTVIDSLRLRHHIALHLGVHARDVQASVVGEHGTSSVVLWSTATVGGAPVLDEFRRLGGVPKAIQNQIESDVRFGNITIIEGIGASQHGIGAVVGRLAEAIVTDENAVFPVASYQSDYDVTLALPSILGAGGVVRTILPRFTDEELAGLHHSAAVLRDARDIALGTAHS
ncbi:MULTISPECIES: NAD(P)-binding domain-containing protein [unclassified Curtobacterium]|uniref:lactate/malate family dehydrogenase n=1 Tax=unclassified Curtobacterium TaxID=257496 RepID=UPI0008DCC91B|nr:MULTISPECIES: NAD(P)-binding domain-containing protein [unclassified Curtobacterium]OIH92399.1 hypothetical protein BIU90_10930 [Curtobacterium sp. MCBA15_001]WIA96989.1 NAD(P)-binding domain-containing protein [Curtobacterium sp. MCBA15_004]WIB00295.1 NAD(P)-binding domain-containing protein [Curtobacterium sp. MCBA15_012]